jgi:hypothetical protein
VFGLRTAAGLLVGVPLAASLALAPAAHGATGSAVTPVTYAWATEVGSVGNAIVVRHADGGGNLRVALQLTANRTYLVSIRRGACGSLGARVAGPFRVVMASDGRDKESIWLSSSVMRLIAGGTGRFSVVVGSGTQCGTLPRKPLSCRATSSLHPWRILVLVSPSVAVSYRVADGTSTAFSSAMSDAETDAVRQAAQAMPGLVTAWSRGTAAVAVTVETLPSPLTRLSYTADGLSAPTERDVWRPLRAAVPFGSYDLVVHVWKPWSDTGASIPAFSWVAYKPSIWTEGAALVELALPQPATNLSAEALVALWLDRAATYYGGFGLGPIPDLGALGNGAYAPDATGSLAAYWSDFLTGAVHDTAGDPLGGITPAMWRSGTPATRPFSCVAVC